MSARGIIDLGTSKTWKERRPVTLELGNPGAIPHAVRRSARRSRPGRHAAGRDCRQTHSQRPGGAAGAATAWSRISSWPRNDHHPAPHPHLGRQRRRRPTQGPSSTRRVTIGQVPSRHQRHNPRRLAQLGRRAWRVAMSARRTCSTTPLWLSAATAASAAARSAATPGRGRRPRPSRTALPGAVVAQHPGRSGRARLPARRGWRRPPRWGCRSGRGSRTGGRASRRSGFSPRIGRSRALRRLWAASTGLLAYCSLVCRG